jgi:hypothetical protein
MYMNELRYNENAHIMKIHKGKSHDELDSKSVISVEIIQQ